MPKPVFLKGLFGSTLIVLVFSASLRAEDTPALYPGFTAIEESMAFKRYLKRPSSDRSKLIFLIERFSAGDIDIEYNGYYFPAYVAGPFARMFLSQNYKGQSVEEWILQWCSRTIPKGQLIHVKLPDGTLRLGREVLVEEMQVFEKALSQQPATDQPAVPSSPR